MLACWGILALTLALTPDPGPDLNLLWLKTHQLISVLLLPITAADTRQLLLLITAADYNRITAADT